MTFRTNALKVQAFAGALFGVQVGTTTMAQVNADITSGGFTNTLNSYYASSFGNVANSTVAASVAANLGLTGDALASGTAYITAQLNGAAAGARGAVISNILDLFAGLASDATFGAAATAWNAKVATANAYTGASNVSIGSTVSQGTAFTLTAGIDSIVGTSGDDSIAATNNANATTFGALDVIDGGAGVDTLSLGLIAAYAGGATIRNVEKLFINQTTAGGFNATGIAGLTDITTSASTVDVAVTNLSSAANITVQNQDTALTVTYSDSAVAGAADAVKLTLNNVAQGAGTTVTLNNTTTTTGATGIETLTVELAGNAGGAVGANTTTLATNAAASLTRVVVTGASAGNLTLGTNVTTTALTIDASAATGNVTLAGMGAVANTITMGSGNDSVDMGGNLTSADRVDGGAGADTLASTAANWATLNTAGVTLANVTNFETLRVTNDAAAGTTINAALVGASNLRLATQTGGEAIIVNNLGDAAGAANVRFDAAVADLTLNIKDATLPGTANVVNLDVRGTSATNTFTMQGVETVTVNASNAVTATTLAMTNAALTSLTVTNAGAATFDTGTLGANVNSVNMSAVTGGGATTITLNGTANTGANVTGSAGVDTITGSNLLDIISSGTGSDVIIQSLGNDRINVGSGTDDFRMVDLGDNNTAITITAGTTIDVVAEGFDIVTGMAAGDTIRMAAVYDDVDADTTLGTTDFQAAVLFNGTFAQNSASLVRGNYNSSTGLFTISASGSDSLFVADVDDATAAADYSGIVLVGYVTAATSATMAEVGTTGVINFTLIA